MAESIVLESKFCTKCGTAKPVSEFAKSKSRKDGLNGHCKECIRQWRIDNLERVRAESRERHEINKAHNNARTARWRDQNKSYAKEYMQKWLETNKPKKAEADRAYRQANKDRVVENKRRYYMLNAEHVKQRVRRYQVENKEKLRPVRAAATRKRFAAVVNALPAWANIAAINAMYDHAAFLSKQSGVRHEVDHIVPLQSKIVCGLHCESNLRVVPMSENRTKGNRWWPDMP